MVELALVDPLLSVLLFLMEASVEQGPYPGLQEPATSFGSNRRRGNCGGVIEG